MYIPAAPFVPALRIPHIATSAGPESHFLQRHPAPRSVRPDDKPQTQTRPRFHSVYSVQLRRDDKLASQSLLYESLRTVLHNRADNTPLQNTNLTIGIVVGVILALFFIGLAVFIWFFRTTIRFSKRKVRRRRKSSGSKSSKASGDSGDPPPPPPPPA